MGLASKELKTLVSAISCVNLGDGDLRAAEERSVGQHDRPVLARHCGNKQICGFSTEFRRPQCQQGAAFGNSLLAFYV